MLEAADLTCERGGRVLFRRLSVSLRAHDLVRVAGENGSGKTSLLRILCGLLEPAGGEVRWNGAPIRSLREEYSRALVFLGHAPAVKGDLSAAENLGFACALAGVPAPAERIAAALAAFGLPADRTPVRRLSQGQRRRAALARLALSADVPLWLLDEPFAALDEAAARRVGEHLAAHAARGGAVAYTTHQSSPLDASVTRVVELA